jgi:hypothetical protein
MLEAPNGGWVLFSHGTCVVPRGAPADLAASAIEILRRWGAVEAGESSADFDVAPLGAVPGWVVACHHPDILVHVDPEDVGGEGADEIDVGLVGRQRRGDDARDLNVVHVENPTNQ